MTSPIKPELSGVYFPPTEIEPLRAEAMEAGIAWFDVNLAGVAGKREFLAACARSLRFPKSFGRNWDALADCLKDLYADSVVNFRDAATFAEAAPDDCATALEIFQDAASYWKERGSTFVALVDAAPEGATLRRLRAR